MTSEPATPKARIIVVDDEQAQMNALCETLRDHAEEIAGTHSAAQALEWLKTGRFDLLLTDLMMPEMDGISLMRAAQQIDPQLVAILMTGAGSIATAVEAMKAGALDYILKPFKLSVILPVLTRALEVRRLRVQNAELQRRVEERSAELERANRELQTLNQELESFSYTVSHDLRAPLRTIVGFVQILESDFSGQWPEDARQLFQYVNAGARKMDELILDLLRLSQFNRQPLEIRAVHVEGLVRAVLQDLSAQQAGREVELSVGSLPDCRADAGLLRQVFTNLLSNAYKYTRRRQQARIEVGGELQGDKALYFVRDNGAGFDMGNARTLFGVFQRFHHADEFEGTGVGLSIVHRVVQRHGGRIWAHAEPDKGAMFSFTLPTR